MIRIENLSKTFATADGVVSALENIKLAIKEGEFVSIVGPSGCGKSTLLMCVAGLIEASSGSVTVGNTRVSGPFTQRTMQCKLSSGRLDPETSCLCGEGEPRMRVRELHELMAPYCGVTGIVYTGIGIADV